MEEIVFVGQNGQVITTSLKVAKTFSKEHKKVMRDIENLKCSSEFNRANFGPISYIDTLGRPQKAYEMTKDGFTFLVMGYTGQKAAEFKEAYIKKFNQMEEELRKGRPQTLTPAESLLQSVQLLVDLERKQKQLEERTDTIGKDVDDIKGRLNNELKSYTVVGYCARNNIEVSRKEASAVGNRASRLCKKKGIQVDTMSDPRFGKVNLYPEDILKELVDNMVAARQTELVM